LSGSLIPVPVFAQVKQASLSDYHYFSYITLTTVGYGDLTPGSGLTRSLAVVEALTGQFYLVTDPGLSQDPAHAIASRQMKHYGPVIGFVLDGEARAEHFLAACQLVLTATSFGGVHTTAERRARWKGDTIPDGFIRLSAGCEDTQDLLEDISQALDALSA
jgi:cystathionine gamma-lyase